MKVRMKATISGTRDGQEWPSAGEVIDLPDLEAADLIHAQLAEPVVSRGAPEAALARAPETATGNTTPKRRGLTKGDLS